MMHFNKTKTCKIEKKEKEKGKRKEEKGKRTCSTKKAVRCRPYKT